MSEKYEDLAERIKRDRDTGPITGLDGETYALRWLDRNPDQVPGQTITAGEVGRRSRLINGHYIETPSIIDFLEALGITVVPDPEPTNAEKWDVLVEKWRKTQDARPEGVTFGEWLDAAGVKAPGGDDD